MVYPRSYDTKQDPRWYLGYLKGVLVLQIPSLREAMALRESFVATIQAGPQSQEGTRLNDSMGAGRVTKIAVPYS